MWNSRPPTNQELRGGRVLRNGACKVSKWAGGTAIVALLVTILFAGTSAVVLPALILIGSSLVSFVSGLIAMFTDVPNNDDPFWKEMEEEESRKQDRY